MANINKPTGLSPFQDISTAPYMGSVNTYFIPQTDTNAYAIGDPVATATGAASADGYSAVTLATAGSSALLRGVIVSMGGTVAGAMFGDPNALNIIVIPATKTQAYYVAVCDDPSVLFEIQENSGASSTNFTSADIGKGCNLKSGTNNGYVSGWTLDDTAASSTSNTRQVRLMGIAHRSDNAFGAYCKFIVMINQHELNFPSSGV